MQNMKSQQSTLPCQVLAERLARTLGRLSGQTHGALIFTAMDSSMQNLSAADSRSFRLGLLSVLARMPAVQQEFLFQAISKTFGAAAETEELSTLQVCELLAYQWGSRGYLRDVGKFQAALDAHVREGDPALALAQFVRNICRQFGRRHQIPALMSLCGALRHARQAKSLIDSFSALCHQSIMIGARPLAMAAVACNDHRLALGLHKLTRTFEHKFYGGEKGVRKVWDWRAWTKYVGPMIADPSVSPEEILLVLGICYGRSSEGALTRQRVDAVEDLAVRLSNSAACSDRQALHYVETCFRYLQTHKVRISGKMMALLTHILTRDMADGQPGRTERLRWFLSLVRKHQGRENEIAVAAALSRWRELNVRFPITKA
jgi:hypothetical protein